MIPFVEKFLMQNMDLHIQDHDISLMLQKKKEEKVE